MANLEQFISTVKNGMQMSYNFDVQFTGPAASEARDLSLLCEEVTVPGMSLASNTVFTYGEPREVVYNRVFEPANFTFLVDINSTALTFFKSWMDKIINPNTRLVSYYNDYVGSVAIKHLNNGRLISAGNNSEKQETYEVTLVDAYPKAIQSYTLSNNTKDILRYSVTMQYKYWERRRVIVPPIQSPRVVNTTSGGLPR
jgi:hypothetical protein